MLACLASHWGPAPVAGTPADIACPDEDQKPKALGARARARVALAPRPDLWRSLGLATTAGRQPN